jgi:hypothetical protein
MTTNVNVNNVDLSNIFASFVSGTKASTTNIKVNGIDILNNFAPYVSGTKASTTNIKVNNNDLSNIFAPKMVGLSSSLSANSVSGCRGCFSLKLIVTGYTGFIIKIRRASDNTTMSFYSSPSGNLTSGTNGSGTSIATFLASTTGYVDTWYDQSGKGNNATQTTIANQPIIDLTNNCLDFGYSTSTNLFMNMPSGTVPVGALDLSYSFVVKYGNSRNLDTGGFIGSGTFTNSTTNSFRLFGAINKYANYWYANHISWVGTTTAVPIITSVTYNGTSKNIVGYFNGSSLLSTTRTGMTNAVATQTIGKTVTTEYLQGQLYSVLIFSTEVPSQDITTLNSL